MGTGAVTVTNSLMERKGWTQEELFNAAYENMQEQMIVSRMEDTLFPDPEPGNRKTEFTFSELSEMSDESSNMYVVTNKPRFWGDGILLMQENLAKLSEVLDSSLVLIPSSVHETIAVPERGADFARDCLSMVKDVNQSTVDPKEQLSDSVYRYDRESRKLERFDQDGSVQEMKLVNPDRGEKEHPDKNRSGNAR